MFHKDANHRHARKAKEADRPLLYVFCVRCRLFCQASVLLGRHSRRSFEKGAKIGGIAKAAQLGDFRYGAPGQRGNLRNREPGLLQHLQRRIRAAGRQVLARRLRIAIPEHFPRAASHSAPGSLQLNCVAKESLPYLLFLLTASFFSPEQKAMHFTIQALRTAICAGGRPFQSKEAWNVRSFYALFIPCFFVALRRRCIRGFRRGGPCFTEQVNVLYRTSKENSLAASIPQLSMGIKRTPA